MNRSHLVDVIAALNSNHVRDLGYRPMIPEAIDRFADPAARQSWIHERNMLAFQLKSDRMPAVPIDILVQPPFDVAAEIARSSPREVSEGVHMPVISRDALVSMKRGTGRVKDAMDVDALEKLERYRDEI